MDEWIDGCDLLRQPLIITTICLWHSAELTLNLAVSSVKFSWLWKPYGAAQSSHGDNNLRNHHSTLLGDSNVNIKHN